MNEEQKKEAIKKLFDVVVKPTDSDSWLDEARAYHEEVRTFAKNAPTLTDLEKKKFFDKFLYKKNGTAGLGQSASFSEENRPDIKKTTEIFSGLLGLLREKDVDEDKARDVCAQMRKDYYAAIKDRKPAAIVNRAIASVLPQLVSAAVKERDFFQAYDWFSENGYVDARTDDDWYRWNIVLMKFLKGCLGDRADVDVYKISHFVWRVHELVDGQEKRSGRPVVKYGPPGTGKTYTAQTDIRNIFNSWSILATGGKYHLPEEGHFCRVQFHPSYGYEDFIEGLRPDENGGLTLVNGDFKTLCKQAGRWECDLYELTMLASCPHEKVSEWLDVAVVELKDLIDKNQFKGKPDVFNKNQQKMIKDLFSKDYWEIIWECAECDGKISLRDAIPPYCMLIDEINRAELSRVFGELMYALEYRGPDGMIKTQYSRLDHHEKDDHGNDYDTAMIRISDGSSRFFVPHNLFILGSMNTIDRSIESFDFALRRRFLWERVPVDLEVAESWLKHNKILKSDDDVDALIESVENLNKKIRTDKGDDGDYEIGHAYLMKYSPRKRLTLNQAKTELWESAVAPLLEEYLRGTGKKLKPFKDVFFPKEKSAKKESAD